jgi:ankyrin repeat protein
MQGVDDSDYEYEECDSSDSDDSDDEDVHVLFDCMHSDSTLLEKKMRYMSWCEVAGGNFLPVGHVDVDVDVDVDVLHELGTSVDALNKNIVHLVADLLLATGERFLTHAMGFKPDINHTDHMGMTPFMYCCARDYVEAAQGKYRNIFKLGCQKSISELTTKVIVSS